MFQLHMFGEGQSFVSTCLEAINLTYDVNRDGKSYQGNFNASTDIWEIVDTFVYLLVTNYWHIECQNDIE